MFDMYVDVNFAVDLTGEHISTIYRKIDNNIYTAKKVDNVDNGKRLKVLLSSLPPAAQLKYLKQQVSDEISEEIKEIDIDMAAYEEKYGEEGMKEFLFKHELVQKALKIESQNSGSQKTKLWEKLAKENGISKRSLDRYVSSYKEFGTKALMKKLDRDNKGKRTSICEEAKRFLIEKYASRPQRTKAKVHDMLIEYAESTGKDACINCIYREGSKARAALEAEDWDIPVCEEEKNGIKISYSLQTVSRILKEDIPQEVYDYATKGRKYWEAMYMHKATREKPQLVNEVWFGDHHVLDVFIKDMNGKIVKPWLTAWFDAATGCIVGWCLNTNPNSQTIAEAFTYGVSEKKDFPFWGVPMMVYTDNGRDYRSHAFEGGNIVEKHFGKGMAFNIETDGILKQLDIGNTHAKAYHGWAKPIERFFGTFASRYVRELPGWCGRNPEERSENFEKELKKLIEKDELLTMDELKEWFIDVLNKYHNTPHSGYNNMTPLEVYQSKEKARYDKPSWALLSILKMESETRIVTTQGIKFDNKLYWHKELRHLVKEEVKIKYNRENKDTIIIIHKGKFICAATAKETLKMVLEDEDRVANHVSNQKRQESEVKARICELTGRAKPKQEKRSSSNMITGEIVESNTGNITVLEHEKAMKGYKEEKVKQSTKKTADEGIMDKRYRETGENILKRVLEK